MSDFQILYLPIGVPTFHMETAGNEFQKTKDLLRSSARKLGFPESTLLMPENILLSIPALEDFIADKSPSLVILQNITFANAAYTEHIMDRIDAPVLLWTLRDPAPDGGRLKLNSLTGAYSAANMMHRKGRKSFSYILGAPEEDRVSADVKAVIRAAYCRYELQDALLLNIGDPPEGFAFGRAEDTELLDTFGVRQEYVDAGTVMETAKALDEDAYAADLEQAERELKHFSDLPEENRIGHARLMKAYADLVGSRHADAVASRCWPDFFTQYGTPVCTVLSMLNDRGVPSSCEADGYGALSMLIGQKLSGQPVFFGDPSSLDLSRNAVIFWHCGMAPPSLAGKTDGPCAGVHCNRGIGPTMEFGCRGGGPATIFRIGRRPDGSFRFFLGTGTALDLPRQYHGTTLAVEWDSDAEEMVRASVHNGWEPHFVVIYGNYAREISALAEIMDIPLERY